MSSSCRKVEMEIQVESSEKYVYYLGMNFHSNTEKVDFQRGKKKIS